MRNRKSPVAARALPVFLAPQGAPAPIYVPAAACKGACCARAAANLPVTRTHSWCALLNLACSAGLIFEAIFAAAALAVGGIAASVFGLVFSSVFTAFAIAAAIGSVIWISTVVISTVCTTSVLCNSSPAVALVRQQHLCFCAT